MILANKRKQVINNIHQNVARQDFHAKAELHDPVLTKRESDQLIQKFWQHKKMWPFQLLNKLINGLFYLITLLAVRIQIDNPQKLTNISRAFVTCNHYNQLDILPMKKLALSAHRRLFFMVEDTNLIMHFPIGLAVRNANSIPINKSISYLGKDLLRHLKQTLQKNNWILLYPEQELWFNYRKPRPLKKGTYYYAAKLQVPIISCFAEIQDCRHSELFHRKFYKTKIILHVLPIIYPDSHLSTSENAKRMRDLDYQQKVKAYEKAYQQKLNYTFSKQDIAGLK